MPDRYIALTFFWCAVSANRQSKWVGAQAPGLSLFQGQAAMQGRTRPDGRYSFTI